MSAVQLKFSLRTSSNVKTVHLLGSWDNYSRQIPLSRDDSKSGSWVGKFRFQTSMLKLGGRYWYYYILDGYHVSHDPAADYTVEPTTGRKLNILDVPSGGSKEPTSSSSSGRRHRRGSTDIATGRALSPSKIHHPKPSKPYASRQIREADFAPTMEDLTRRFAGSRMSDEYDDLSPSPPSLSSGRSRRSGTRSGSTSTSTSSSSYSYSNSPPSSVGSSLSSRSSGSTSPSSLSSLSDPPSLCHCERYGITRKGDRVKLDCGGSRCGYLTESSGDSCSEDSDSDEEYRHARRAVRRQGIVVRR